MKRTNARDLLRVVRRDPARHTRRARHARDRLSCSSPSPGRFRDRPAKGTSRHYRCDRSNRRSLSVGCPPYPGVPAGKLIPSPAAGRGGIASRIRRGARRDAPRTSRSSGGRIVSRRPRTRFGTPSRLRPRALSPPRPAQPDQSCFLLRQQSFFVFGLAPRTFLNDGGQAEDLVLLRP